MDRLICTIVLSAGLLGASTSCEVIADKLFPGIPGIWGVPDMHEFGHWLKTYYACEESRKPHKAKPEVRNVAHENMRLAVARITMFSSSFGK